MKINKNIDKKIESIIMGLKENAGWEEIKRIIVKIEGKKKELLEIRKARAEEFHRLLNNPYNLIGIGAFRAAFEVDGYALKIAIRNKGIEDLYCEKLFWDSIPSKYKMYFSECFYVEEGFGIFELAPLMPSHKIRIYEESMKNALNELSNDIIVRDNWYNIQKNWGLRGEFPVIFDYADCELIRVMV